MKGFLKINDDTLGEVDFKVIAEGMGVVGGDLTVCPVSNRQVSQRILFVEGKRYAQRARLAGDG